VAIPVEQRDERNRLILPEATKEALAKLHEFKYAGQRGSADRSAERHETLPMKRQRASFMCPLPFGPGHRWRSWRIRQEPRKMNSTLYVGMGIILLSCIGLIGIVCLAGLMMSAAIDSQGLTGSAFKERQGTLLALAAFPVMVGLLVYATVLIMQYYGG
jgi:hypothetical protein